MNEQLLGINELINNPNYEFKSLQDDLNPEDNSPYLGIDLQCNYFDQIEFLNKYSHNNCASIFSLNIDGLASKLSQLRDFTNFFSAHNYLFDIIALQEINDIKESSLLTLPNYSSLVYKKRTLRRKGGVGFYISQNITFKVCEQLSLFEEGIFESLFIEVEFTKNKKTLLGNFYKPPNLNHEQTEIFFQKFQIILDKIEETNKKCILVGDFNLCLLKGDSFHPTEEFIDTLFSFGYLQLINYPTRVSHNANHASATLIDHIWTNILKETYTSGIFKAFLSDHFPTFTLIDIEKTKITSPKSFSNRIFSNENLEAFKHDLDLLTFDEITSEIETQTAYNKFHATFFSLYNRHFPIREVKFNRNIHKKENWMSNGLLISRKNKILLGNQKAINPTLENIKRFKDYKNIYNKLLRLAKKLYYSKLLIDCQGNMKKSWSTIREATGLSTKKSEITDYLTIDNEVIHGDLNIANCFNEHFSNIACKIQNDVIPSDRPPDSFLDNHNTHFEFCSVTPQLIIDTFNELKVKKTTDFSGLSTYFLKNVINKLSIPLAHIFNQSLETGLVPEQCKIAKITPIFKKGGNEDNVNDYRPISLLSIFSKILEKIVCNNLKDYLINNTILNHFQFGFQNDNSTFHPMMQLVNKIGESFNNNEYTLAIFCDLSKAFDVVPINLLLKKLENIGILGNKLRWFESYLFRRRQFVKIRENESSYKYITSGVPQGSILGPILFLIFINDIPNCTLLSILLFADDTTLFASGKNLNDLINFVNIELRKVSQWFRSNKMSLHPVKTQFTIFHHDPDSIPWEDIKIYLDENDPDCLNYDENLKKQITCVNHTSNTPAIKFLGIYFDPKLDFKFHCKQINLKLSRSLFILRQCKNILTEKAMKALYYSTFHCHLTYGILIYTCVCKSTLQGIIKKQKAAIRLITNSRYNDHTKPLFKSQKILPFESLIQYFGLKFFFDYKINMLPRSFSNTWHTVGEINNRYPLRNAHTYVIPRFRTIRISQFPLWSLPRIWNDFDDPENIKSFTSRNMFSYSLKKILINRIQTDCSIINCRICQINA